MSEVVEVLVPASPAVVEVVIAGAASLVEVAVPGIQGPTGPDGWSVPIQKVTAAGPTQTIDYALGKHCELTLTGNVTLSFTGWPAADYLARLTVEVVNTGSFSITWPGAVKWSGGSVAANSVGAGKLDTFIFTTIDGGSVIKGHIAGLAFA